MAAPIPFPVVLRLRNRAYHRGPQLRVGSPAGAPRLVPAGGFYDHPAVGRSWNWKDEALDKRRWYYGRLLHGRATLVSLEFLPVFYALSENYGDPGEFLQQYQEGRLSAEAKSVYESLLHLGP